MMTVRKNSDILGLALILMSSVLLGVWALKGTIALRNILLIAGSVCSIFYCLKFLKSQSIKIPLKNYMPLFFLGLMFFWVIFHYYFLAHFPEIQRKELTSTWLRSFLAVTVAIGTGFALNKRPNAIKFLWIGILISFFYLFYQYVPKAISLKSFFAQDYDNYIFYGKISGVLTGTILVVGLIGTVVDTLKRHQFWDIFRVIILWLVSTTIVLYAYIFIFDTRNGVGLAILCYGAIIVAYIWHLFRSFSVKGVGRGSLTLLGLIIVSIVLLGFFGVKHIQKNPGWLSILQDAKIAIQVEKYPHWQNPEMMGYPFNSAGQVVQNNTYERVAWATVATTVLLNQNPLGIGSLTKPFKLALMEVFPNSDYPLTGTHSAWVDIALAFGYPGLFLMLAALVSITWVSIGTQSPFQYVTSILSIGIILLYTVGEVGSQHGIEILCFLIALMSSLLLPNKSL